MGRTTILLAAVVAMPAPAADPPLPPGVLARLGDPNFRSEAAEFALSPDGTSVAVPLGEASARILDVRTWEDRVRLDPPEPPAGPKRVVVKGFPVLVHRLRFSPDGTRLAAAINTGSTGFVATWDLATGKVVRTSLGPWPGFTHAFDLSADLRRFAWFSDARKPGERAPSFAVQVRDQESGTTTVIPVGRLDVDSLAFAPDGKRVAAWSRRERPPEPGQRDARYEFKVWDVATGEEAAAGRLPKPAQDLVWAPGGRAVAVRMGKLAFEERGVWDLKGGKLVSRFTCPEGTGPLFFLADDIVGAVGLGGRVEWRDPATGKVVRQADGPAHPTETVTAVAVGRPDGRVRFCGRAGAMFAVWDVGPDDPKPTPVAGGFDGPARSPIALAFTADGKALRSIDEYGTLHEWDVAGRRLARTTRLLETPWRFPPRARLSADARFGVVFRQPVRLWDCDRGREVTRYPVGLSVAAVEAALHPEAADALRKLDARYPKSGRARLVAVVPLGGGLVAALDRGSGDGVTVTLTVSDPVADRTVSSTAIPRDQPRTLVVSPDGRHVVAAGGAGLLVFDWRAGRVVCSVPNGADAVPGLSPDGRLLARALEGRGGIEVRELVTGGVRLRLGGPARGAVAFAPDGRALAAAAPDATLLLWDLTPPKGAAAWDPSEAAAVWDGLADPDARRGYEPMARLLAHPDATARLVRDRVKLTDSAAAVARLVAQLDDDQLAVREAASRELGQLGEPAVEPLRRVLDGSPSPEVRRRIEFLVDELAGRAAAAAVRPVRVVEVLERLGTPAARELLEAFADSADESVLRREARAAVARARGANQ